MHPPAPPLIVFPSKLLFEQAGIQLIGQTAMICSQPLSIRFMTTSTRHRGMDFVKRNHTPLK
jgi:hypothetical protein